MISANALLCELQNNRATNIILPAENPNTETERSCISDSKIFHGCKFCINCKSPNDEVEVTLAEI